MSIHFLGECDEAINEMLARATLLERFDSYKLWVQDQDKDATDEDGLTANERDDVARSTVRVTGIACGRTTQGSGFAVRRDLVATNAHVLVGVDTPTVELGDGTSLDGEIVAFNVIDDLALIRVRGADFEPLPLGPADDGTVGAVFGWEPGPTVDPTPFRIDRPVTVRIEAVAQGALLGVLHDDHQRLVLEEAVEGRRVPRLAI